MMRAEVVMDLRNAGWPEDLVNGYFLKHGDFDALIVEGVRKSMGGKELLNNASLVINKGEVVGLIGMSGVGKTTFLKMLVGFLGPDSGSISVRSGGKFVGVSDSSNLFGFAAQNPSFYEKLSVEENLVHFGSLLGVEDTSAVINGVLTQFDLGSVRHSLAGDLSRGQQKRLDIALALLSEPKVLVLDEPTSDLDAENRERVWKMVKDLQKKGVTIVIASHSLQELMSVCNRFYGIRGGALVSVSMSKSFEVRVQTRRRSYDFAKGLKVSYLINEGSLVVNTKNPNDVILQLNRFVKRSNDRIESCVVREVVKPSWI